MNVNIVFVFDSQLIKQIFWCVKEIVEFEKVRMTARLFIFFQSGFSFAVLQQFTNIPVSYFDNNPPTRFSYYSLAIQIYTSIKWHNSLFWRHLTVNEVWHPVIFYLYTYLYSEITTRFTLSWLWNNQIPKVNYNLINTLRCWDQR